MSLTFYYAPMSSSTRVHWALEELGLPYEKIRIDLRASEQHSADFLRLNPHGKVPVLVVDGVPMFESLAILIYLGERFGVARNLWFDHSHRDYPKILSWLVWGTVSFFTNIFSALHASKDPDHPVSPALGAKLKSDLDALESHLAGRQYLFDERFTLVDLAITAMVPFAISSNVFDLEAHPRVSAWVSRCTSRPDMATALQG